MKLLPCLSLDTDFCLPSSVKIPKVQRSLFAASLQLANTSNFKSGSKYQAYLFRFLSLLYLGLVVNLSYHIGPLILARFLSLKISSSFLRHLLREDCFTLPSLPAEAEVSFN